MAQQNRPGNDSTHESNGEKSESPYHGEHASLAAHMGEQEMKRGASVLLGLACGDALGRPVEFKSRQNIQREHGTVTEMLGDGSHGKPPGTVTDDTDLALCIAQSLDERDGFRPVDIASRFVRWLENGPFDIGVTTSRAIQKLDDGVSWDETGRQAWVGSNAGNGSVMRCAPIALAYQDDMSTLIEASKQSSLITHYDPRCVYGCVILNLTIAGLLDGIDYPLQTALDHVEDEAPSELIDALDPIYLSGTSTRIDPSDLGNSGYVVETLQTALYYGLNSGSAKTAIVKAVNRGGDADTIGAVTGAVVGARFGEGSLPNQWTDVIIEAAKLKWLGRSLISSKFEPLEETVVNGFHPNGIDGSTGEEERHS